MRKCRIARSLRLAAITMVALSSNGLASIAPTYAMPRLQAASGEPTHRWYAVRYWQSTYSANVTIGTPLRAADALGCIYVHVPVGAVQPPGNTVATNGLAGKHQRNERPAWLCAGTGITQTDPAHAETASTLGCNFAAVWDIATGTTFGPPLAGIFSGIASWALHVGQPADQRVSRLTFIGTC